MTAADDRLAHQGEMLGNRLKKRFRHFSRLAKHDDTDAFRLYDRDIPEVPLAIDRYGDHLHLASYARAEPDEEEAFLAAMAAAAARALELPLEHTATKPRVRKAGQPRSAGTADEGRRVVVKERGFRFGVELWGSLHTGLLLGHRATRGLVAEESGGKRVLCLYGCTGAFGVYAQGSGALQLTQVDLSQRALGWADDNLRLNALPQGELVQEDVLPFLHRAREAGRRFDLAIVDPPTFASGKGMEGTFDVKRDHDKLLAATREVMSDEGVVWFCTSARGFSLSPEVARGYAVKDVSARTRAWDFGERHSHKAWRLRRA